MSNTLKLKTLHFKAGARPNGTPLEITCPNVIVLIGPNNAGKSQTLRDIEAEFSAMETKPSRTVLKGLELEIPQTAEEIKAMMAPFDATSAIEANAIEGYRHYRRPSMAGQPELHFQFNDTSFAGWLQDENLQQLYNYFVRFFTRRLDGATRFDLVRDQETGALDGKPANHLWALFQNTEAREKISKFTQEAFGRFFVIDPTGMTMFRMRLSDRAPLTIQEEQSLDSQAQAFHKAASHLSSLGDGVKASVGLVAAVHSLPDRILLVDEPEAFLHPTLARRMGRTLTETVRERDASLVVATHSAEFLIGCIQATTQLRLVRLTHEGTRSTARTIEPSEISTLMNDPLLRSANALRALFHRGVIVCEADADRAFYEEINSRLTTKARGIDDALFMNAQNWQTIARIAQPLRRLGVPAAAVMDLDVLMDVAFKQHVLPLITCDESERNRLIGLRARVKGYMDAKGRTIIKAAGLEALAGFERQEAESLISELARFGVFLVPVGELEGWMKHSVAPSNDKSRWILHVFSFMGADPEAASYMEPGSDDVWVFLESIKAWIDDPARLGIPD